MFRNILLEGILETEAKSIFEYENTNEESDIEAIEIKGKKFEIENIPNEIKDIKMETDNIEEDTLFKTSDEKLRNICEVWYGDEAESIKIYKETNNKVSADGILNITRDNLIDNGNNLENDKLVQVWYNDDTKDYENQSKGNDIEIGKLDVSKEVSISNQIYSTEIESQDETNVLNNEVDDNVKNVKYINSIHNIDNTGVDRVDNELYESGSDNMVSVHINKNFTDTGHNSNDSIVKMKHILEKRCRRIKKKLQKNFETESNKKGIIKMALKMTNGINDLRMESLSTLDNIQDAEEVTQILDKIKLEMDDIIRKKLEYIYSDNSNDAENITNNVARDIKDEFLEIKFNPIRKYDSIREKVDSNLEYSHSVNSEEVGNKIDDTVIDMGKVKLGFIESDETNNTIIEGVKDISHKIQNEYLTIINMENKDMEYEEEFQHLKTEESEVEEIKDNIGMINEVVEKVNYNQIPKLDYNHSYNNESKNIFYKKAKKINEIVNKRKGKSKYVKNLANQDLDNIYLRKFRKKSESRRKKNKEKRPTLKKVKTNRVDKVYMEIKEKFDFSLNPEMKYRLENQTLSKEELRKLRAKLSNRKYYERITATVEKRELYRTRQREQLRTLRGTYERRDKVYNEIREKFDFSLNPELKYCLDNQTLSKEELKKLRVKLKNRKYYERNMATEEKKEQQREKYREQKRTLRERQTQEQKELERMKNKVRMRHLRDKQKQEHIEVLRMREHIKLLNLKREPQDQSKGIDVSLTETKKEIWEYTNREHQTDKDISNFENPFGLGINDNDDAFQNINNEEEGYKEFVEQFDTETNEYQETNEISINEDEAYKMGNGDGEYEEAIHQFKTEINEIMENEDKRYKEDTQQFNAEENEQQENIKNKSEILEKRNVKYKEALQPLKTEDDGVPENAEMRQHKNGEHQEVIQQSEAGENETEDNNDRMEIGDKVKKESIIQFQTEGEKIKEQKNTTYKSTSANENIPFFCDQCTYNSTRRDKIEKHASIIHKGQYHSLKTNFMYLLENKKKSIA